MGALLYANANLQRETKESAYTSMQDINVEVTYQEPVDLGQDFGIDLHENSTYMSLKTDCLLRELIMNMCLHVRKS